MNWNGLDLCMWIDLWMKSEWGILFGNDRFMAYDESRTLNGEYDELEWNCIKCLEIECGYVGHVLKMNMYWNCHVIIVRNGHGLNSSLQVMDKCQDDFKEGGHLGRVEMMSWLWSTGDQKVNNWPKVNFIKKCKFSCNLLMKHVWTV